MRLKPSDTVWINSGCVHWIQADGWCNNIMWNVGPLSQKQYNLALEKYEWNKMQSYKAVIPMVNLTWNIARNVRLSDVKIYEAIRGALVQSLRQVALTVETVKSKNKTLSYQTRQRNELARFCGLCENEVFAILFVREENGKPMIHCLGCASRKMSDLRGFVCLEECRLKELMEVYDSFRLHSSASTPSNMHMSHAASSMGGSNSMPSTPTGARSRLGSDQGAGSSSASSMTASALAQASGVLRQGSLGSMSAADVATISAMYNQLAAYSGQQGRSMDIG